MAEMMPEPVREHIDAALAAPSGDHLVDAAGGHRVAILAAFGLRPVGSGSTEPE
jgi:hypothetical protein